MPPVRTVILIRRSLGGPGGAERVFRKYLAALQGDYKIIPVSENEDTKGQKGSSATRAKDFTKLADKIIAQHPGALSISLERGPSAQVFRAGDGVHKHYRKLTGGISFNPIHKLYPKLDEKSLLSAKIIIANSKMVATEIAQYYPIVKNKIRVIYNGIDMEKFSPGDEPQASVRKRLNLPVDKKLILFMGNGWARKGLKQALQIAKLCDATLVAVGKGKLSEIKNEVNKKNIIFCGVVDNMPDYYRACDAFVLPTAYDPFTSSVLEALSCGLPVVTTRHNGASEAVQQGITGYVMPTQKEEIKQAAAWLNKNIGPDRNKIAQTVKDFTAQREIEEIKKIFAELEKK